MFPLRSVINNRNIWKSLAVGRAAATTRSTAQMEEDVSMQVPAHSITARSLPRICIGTVGGNPPACRVRRLPVAVPRQSIVWGGCRVSGQRTSSSDLGAAASSRNYQLPRSRPQRLRTATSLRPARPQCAAEPLCAAQRSPAACRRPATLQPRTLLTRRPLHAHDGTDGGDLAPGEPTSLRALCT